MQACQLFDGIGEFRAIVFHDKADGIAVGTTTETVIELLLPLTVKEGLFSL